MLKVLNILFWSLISVGVIVSLAFVEVEQKEMPCSAIRINISNDGENFFVEENDIVEILLSRGENVIGESIASINITEIENSVISNPSIQNAEVYSTVKGELVIDVEQRKPLARVFSSSGESFYLDEKGKLMPVSDKFTSRVMIVSGNVNQTFGANYQTDFSAKPVNTEGQEIDSVNNNLYAAYYIASFVTADPFWKAQIEQVYFDDENEINVVPRVGNHKIIFGDTLDLAGKFTKLKLFYERGLNNTGWNHYSVINLKYKDQVVCKRKPIKPNNTIAQ